MILVTGATGHFGNATINSLLQKGAQPSQILALVRNESAIADELKNKGVNTIIGDYDNYNSLLTAFAGVEKLLFVSSSDIIKRSAQHQNVINAAKEAGVKHLIYTSFQRKNESDTSPLWIVAQSHIQTEKWLKESGINYTILKNNLYMDFLPAFIGEKVAEIGFIYVPAENGKVSAVLRSEMAEAAANILLTDGHMAKEYDFTNVEAVSYHEIAAIIADIIKKPVNYVSPSAEEYAKTLSSYGLPPEAVGIFSSFAVAQAQGELDVESTDLEKLLGRKPTAVKDFLTTVYATQG
jgi:NAD(P)H dehydrogenase (quinone)